MAVILSTNSRSYTARSRSTTVTFPETGEKLIVVTFTHPDWPTGEVLRLNFAWGNGDSGMLSTGGFVVRDKAGNATGGTTDLVWTLIKPSSVTTCDIVINNLQTLTTAIKIEVFPWP